jgi:hypothetical protein
MLRCTIEDEDCCDGDGLVVCEECSGAGSNGFEAYLMTECPYCSGTGHVDCHGIGCHELPEKAREK